jgi:hypothetical protein
MVLSGDALVASPFFVFSTLEAEPSPPDNPSPYADAISPFPDNGPS